MMTRDDVMEMPDVELRIKAAELMGWIYYCETSDITGHDDRGPCGRPPDGWVDARGEREDCLYELPDYPNDIAATVELWFPDKYLYLHRIGPGFGGCGVEYIRHIRGSSRTYGLYEPCRGDEQMGVTSGRAITRAFVLAMETE